MPNLRFLRCSAHLLSALAFGLAAASNARAGTVGVTGDLGIGNWGTPASIFINTSWTQPFQQSVNGRGIITGDVVMTNNSGTHFDLVVTNLSFQATAPTPLGGTTHVKINVVQGFQPQTPNGTYNAAHTVSGNWSLGFGNLIVCDSLQGMLGPNPVWLPQLITGNNFGTPSFGVPLAGATVSNSSPSLFGIATTIELFIDGNGFIDLPNSYDLGVTEVVPTPGALALFGLAVIARRRGR